MESTSIKGIDPLSETEHHEFRGRTARGALASIFGQASNFILRIGSMMVLARLLSPRDFGLVGMATAITGFLILFQDAGLSTASVQSPSISKAQISMLFWINVAVGGLLFLLCAVTSPLLAAFFKEPRVEALTIVIASGFLFNGLAAQHRAMLSRNMRITVLAASDLCATALGIALGISMAVCGFGYWSLAGMVVLPSIITLITAWMFGPWLPGLPRRGTGVGAMLRYGGILMADNILMYIAYNTDKVLLGRFWGAQALGFYGRAYQLVNIPTANLNNAVSAVAFPALSRLQHQPERFRGYFLKCYTLFLTLTMPITVACGLFGEDIIRVFLGPKWMDAVPVFRLLAPTIIAFALINPTGLLLNALGKVVQSLRIGALIVPVIILGYVLGLGYGPVGVASGFSASALILIVPVILLAIRGTPISSGDMWGAIRPPLYSILTATVVALLLYIPVSGISSAFLRLLILNSLLFGSYALMLFFVMGQKELYLKVLREFGFGKRARRRTCEMVI
jgi:O-antigen/teichoic acid export membrane protein